MLARRTGRIHFVGVCGVGMAGLAALLAEAGFEVDGCDRAPNRLARWLEAKGVAVSDGHDPEHVGRGADLVVRSAAVRPDAPEIRVAEQSGVPVFSRGEVLSRFPWPGLVAVGGTHGKTTTTAFVAQLLSYAGREPSWCVGGEVSGCGCVGVAASGKGDVTVVEADESDGTLALYRSDVAVVTNIEFDHMEHFRSEEAVRECFRAFMRNAETVVYCGDDAEACRVSGVACGAKCTGRFVSYGFGGACDVGAVDVVDGGMSQEFTLVCGGENHGRVRLNVPGRHNILNALAAAAVGLELGVTVDEVTAGLAEVHLPGRRFEVVGSLRGARVISDYAHHPSEIAALVRTAGGLDPNRILAVFQPHRYTRTLALGGAFPAAFDGVAEVVLLPVYAASEGPLAGGTVWDLYARFREAGWPAGTVCVATSLEQAWLYAGRKAGAGDVILIAGAGDVGELATRAWKEIRAGERANMEHEGDALVELAADVEGLVVRCGEPLGARTMFGVGGECDIWAEVSSEAALARLLAWCADRDVAFRIMGAGSNVLVSDLGMRGVVGRLEGETLRHIGPVEHDGDATTVGVGAATAIAVLLERLERESLAGLEFMEGIPGTVGGALRMNAGAMGDEICRHVSWIRCLNMAGSQCMVNPDQLRFGYRNCDSIEGHVVVEAGLIVRDGRSEEIASRRRQFRERRKWMSGLRCAGSVFRNPPEGAAGRLIDQAGLKGARVGGAVVSASHANVIVAEQGACASDVLALMEKMRGTVLEQHGISLENEIVILE